MKINNNFDSCYRECIKIGFVKNGQKCDGEQMHPNEIRSGCLRCPHFKGGLNNAH